MNIAIVDIAAENSGALSVLLDFVDFIDNSNDAKQYNWFVFVSNCKHFNKKNNHINIIELPNVKKSWGHRLLWDLISCSKYFNKYKIDLIISLQNTGFPFVRNIPQIVYFHNMLLLEDKNKYSLFNANERKFAIYTKVLSRYTQFSLKKVNEVIVQTKSVKANMEKKWKINKIIAVKPNIELSGITVNERIGKSINGLIYPANSIIFKRHDEIIECINKHMNWFTDNDFKIIFTIDGTENSLAEGLYDKARNNKNIEFMGYVKREKIYNLMNYYGLFLNSEIESYPIPFEEAKTKGIPILAADYPYAREILEEYENKLLFKKHDLEDMFDKIVEISKNKIIPQKIVPIKYNTWNNVLHEIKNVYSKWEKQV